MIPTSRHLSYAKGYIELGMVNEASDELEQIDWDDRLKAEVLAVRLDLYLATKNWELMVAMANALAKGNPEQSQWWVQWAYALREWGKAEEAKEVALKRLELHPDEAILHFNLACYLSLLGEFEEAKKHLNRSIRLDKRFQAASVEDEDLKGLWDWFGTVAE